MSGQAIGDAQTLTGDEAAMLARAAELKRQADEKFQREYPAQQAAARARYNECMRTFNERVQERLNAENEQFMSAFEGLQHANEQVQSATEGVNGLIEHINHAAHLGEKIGQGTTLGLSIGAALTTGGTSLLFIGGEVLTATLTEGVGHGVVDTARGSAHAGEQLAHALPGSSVAHALHATPGQATLIKGLTGVNVGINGLNFLLSHTPTVLGTSAVYSPEMINAAEGIANQFSMSNSGFWLGPNRAEIREKFAKYREAKEAQAKAAEHLANVVAASGGGAPLCSVPW